MICLPCKPQSCGVYFALKRRDFVTQQALRKNLSLIPTRKGKNKGNFLSVAAYYLIQQAGRGAFRFPCRVSVDVHGGTDVSVSQKLLYILRRCPIGEQIAGERVPKLMEVEAFKPRYLL